MTSVRRLAPFLAGLSLLAAAGAISAPAIGADRTATPPPTPVPPFGSPSPFLGRLATPGHGSVRPTIHAAAALLADPETGQVLFSEAPRRRRPIASVTKIMTALLVLERTQPSDVVTVSRRVATAFHASGLSVLGLREGERMVVEELTYALLLQSANDAAVALAEHVSGSMGAFVRAMNRRAERLGLSGTLFRSPHGLDDRGYSTAQDLFTLTATALELPAFGRIVRTRFDKVTSLTRGPRFVQNRNVLLWLYRGAVGVKTGFTSAAGFNVVAAAERHGRELVAVVLGVPGEPFSDAASLLNFGFTAFEERTLVSRGESFGVVAMNGGSVRAAAGADVGFLVPRGAHGDVRRTVVLDRSAGFPPAVGEEIGAIRVSVADLPPASAPLVVTAVPAPPLPPEGPWWGRAAGAVGEAVGIVIRAVLS